MKEPMSLHQLLEQFRGKTPDQIAEMVRRRGIKGRSGTTSRCPMALLLNGVATGQHVIGRTYIARRSGDTIEKVRTPKNVADFVRKFDIAGYPELIAPPPRCVAPPAKAKHRPGRPSRPSGPKSPRVIVNHVAKMVNRFGRQP